MIITYKLLNNAGIAITGEGANLKLKIYRDVDGYIYDWNDSTFKASGWTTLASPLTEIDSTNLAGGYLKNVNITAFNDGYYSAFIDYTGTPNQSGQSSFYVKDGVESHAVVANIDTNVTTLLARRVGLKKNTALANFPFTMSSLTSFQPLAGLTVTPTRSLDGGAFASCTNAVVEIGSGAYKINLSAADTNADTIIYKFTAALAEPVFVQIITQG